MFEMDLRDGKYNGKEICACFGDWIIVYDGKLNYMVFSTTPNEVLRRFMDNRLPSNDIGSQRKFVEYYSTFDNAIDFGLLPVLYNGGCFLWLKQQLLEV